MKVIDPRVAEIYEEIRDLRKCIRKEQRQLSEEKDRGSVREIRRDIADMKQMLAWSLLNCGQFKKGLAIYLELPWRTHGKEKYLGIGRALTEMGFYAAGRRVLEKGLKRFPEEAPLSIALGLVFQRSGDDAVALKHFEKALLHDPENRYALYDKSTSLINLCYVEEATHILQRLGDLYPDDPDYAIDLGFCYLTQGYTDDALRYYQKAYDLGYCDPSVYAGLYCSYQDMGYKTDALYYAKKGLDEFPEGSPEMYFNMGDAYLAMGWTEEAHSILKEGLKKFPDDETIKYLLDEIEKDENNPDKGNKPPVGSLLILLALILNQIRNRNK